jgi:sigma54-dependent transcription regulator
MDLLNDNRGSWIDQNGSTRLQSLDMAVATRTSVPVLISAPVDSALPLALEIAGGTAAGGADGVVVVDAADHRRLRSAFTRASEDGLSHLRTIVVQGVEALDQAQQSALMALVADAAGPQSRACRIIATTSVTLFDRVTQGSFDSDLFYRLNRIHIKVGAHPAREH